MKSTIFISFIISAMCFVSCKNESQIEVFGIKTKKKYLQLENANWFLGEWKNTSPEMDFTENWKKETDSSYRAQSFIVAANDTVFFEHVLLEEANDSLFYRAYERKEKLSQAVSFYATKIDSNQIIFENPKHDFPTKIIYKKVTTDSIVASIYGKQKGKSVSETFPMKRKN
ncbi:MAG TPA: DUF6265 family protein [Flavobacterium sp.]|nr:DUF6265 family protein [Flavobacterium sp.]